MLCCVLLYCDDFEQALALMRLQVHAARLLMTLVVDCVEYERLNASLVLMVIDASSG